MGRYEQLSRLPKDSFVATSLVNRPGRRGAVRYFRSLGTTGEAGGVLVQEGNGAAEQA